MFSCRISAPCVHSYRFYISPGTNQSKHKSCSKPTKDYIRKCLHHTLGPILWLKRHPRATLLCPGRLCATSYKHHHTAPRGQVNASPRFHQSKMCASFIIREREATLADRLLSVPDEPQTGSHRRPAPSETNPRAPAMVPGSKPGRKHLLGRPAQPWGQSSEERGKGARLGNPLSIFISRMRRLAWTAAP